MKNYIKVYGIVLTFLLLNYSISLAESEPNNELAQATALSINSSDNGSLTYSDTYDWWKIILPKDGNIKIETYSDAGLNVDLYLYDTDGSTRIDYGHQTGAYEVVNYENIKSGTYYILVQRCDGEGAYTIHSEFIQEKYESDPEPNDNNASAQQIDLHTVCYGHLGYYGNGEFDNFDWYRITVPAGLDTLFIRIDSDSTLDVRLILYDENISIVQGVYTSENTKLLSYESPVAGNYFILLNRNVGYGSYGLIATDVEPEATMTGIEIKNGKGSILLKEFSVSQNYPNPFNPSTSIKIQIPVTSHVTVKIYNILGKEVATLIDEQKAAGIYTIALDAGDLPCGVYFYRVQAGNFIETRKAVLTK